MSKKTWYTKYRPFQLSDVVGQFYTVSTLRQASIKDEFSHAYLFGGIKGCGKTTTARILANLLTCENPKDGVLCGECIACRKIHDGTALDVIELDGASKGKVENVENIIENALWAPTELKKKVIIIDEIHLLTDKAIAYLLKITEEPPEHLVFIFATTEIHKLLGTMVSRSQRYMFTKISLKDIVGRLKYIAGKEGMNITDEALFAIAKLGRGSMRDAIGCLQQISTIAGQKNIDETSVCKYFGVADRKGIFDIIKSIIECNVSVLMDQVNDMVMSNADEKSILYEVSELFRNIMVLKAQKGATKLLELPDHEIDLLSAMSSSIKFNQLEKVSKAFSTVEKEINYSINKRWVMESTLLRCAVYLRSEK